MQLVILNSVVLDGTGKEPFSCSALVIEDGIVLEIVPKGIRHRYSKSTVVIEGRNKFCMPGLIDCHVHIHCSGKPFNVWRQESLETTPEAATLQSLYNAQQYLGMGYTTVRHMGMAPGYADVALRDAIASGRVLGPRILACGHGLSITGGHMDTKGSGIDSGPLSSGVADGVDGFRHAARLQLKRGADHLKINASGGAYSDGQVPGEPQMTLEEVKAVCEEAHRDNRVVGAHAMGTAAIEAALQGGVDTIEHGYWLTEEQMTYMIENDVSLVPTLSANTRILENWPVEGLDVAKRPLVEAAAKANCECVSEAHKMGVQIAAGSDGGTAFNKPGTTAYELELLCRSGLTSTEAITAATSSAARSLGLEEITGSIKIGKSGDILLLDANPVDDITVLQKKEHIMHVIVRGVVAKGDV